MKEKTMLNLQEMMIDMIIAMDSLTEADKTEIVITTMTTDASTSTTLHTDFNTTEEENIITDISMTTVAMLMRENITHTIVIETEESSNGQGVETLKDILTSPSTIIPEVPTGSTSSLRTDTATGEMSDVMTEEMTGGTMTETIEETTATQTTGETKETNTKKVAPAIKTERRGRETTIGMKSKSTLTKAGLTRMSREKTSKSIKF
jgi:hypothetical protein